MGPDNLEVEALKLEPKARARLAGKLLESLETLTDEENARLWAEEVQQREADLDTHPGSGSSAEEALRDARAKLR